MAQELYGTANPGLQQVLERMWKNWAGNDPKRLREWRDVIRNSELTEAPRPRMKKAALKRGRHHPEFPNHLTLVVDNTKPRRRRERLIKG